MIHNVQTLACLFKELVCDTCTPIHFSFKEKNWLVIRNAQAIVLMAYSVLWRATPFIAL